MIGFSLSLCIRDIVNGKVKIEDVTLITTGTRACTDEDWNYVLDQYATSYWRYNPAEAKRVAHELRDSGRIHQPRCSGAQPLSHTHVWRTFDAN